MSEGQERVTTKSSLIPAYIPSLIRDGVQARQNIRLVPCNYALFAQSFSSPSPLLPLPQGAGISSQFLLYKKKRDKKIAFTLAEVLVTLGIIGVVAAMTLPSLIQNYQHKVLETQFKKAYSILNQLVLYVQNDSGMPLNVRDYSYAYTGDKWKLYNALKPYIIANFCKNEFCIDSIEVDDGTGQNMKNYRTYNNMANTSSYYMECGGFILPDGMAIYIENWKEKNLMLSIDINGVGKRPNRWGHDLFTFSIDNETGKLIPIGVVDGLYSGPANREEYCSLTNSNKNNGITCSYYALNDPDYFKNLPD